MREALMRVAALEYQEGRPISLRAWTWALAPVAAPLLILLCAPRYELAAVAVVWVVFTIPGFLLGNVLYASSHPLGRAACRPAVAAVFALLLFGVPSWTACMLHWTLSRLLAVYGCLYVAATAACVCWLVRRQAMPAPGDDDVASTGQSRRLPRLIALIALVLLVVVLVAVVRSSPPTSIVQKNGRWVENRDRYDRDKRPDWWHGPVLGATASVVAAGAILAGSLAARSGDAESDSSTARTPNAAKQTQGSRPRRRRGRRSTYLKAGPIDWARWLQGVYWAACGVLTIHLMRVTFTVTVPEMPLLASGALPWNVDDVAYVSEAVDYRYGEPLGRYEPSIGSNHGMHPTAMSPLFAPLVATISRVTGVGCAALHHSVMPPLIVLLGVSSLAAAFFVVFRERHWSVPLALLITLMMICKTWDFDRCLVEMLAARAVQPKAVQLWLLQPMQLASLLLLARFGTGRHLAVAVAAAIVGHLTHPIAAIMGAVWCTALIFVLLLERRRTAVGMAALLGVYCGLGGVFHFISKQPLENGPLSSGRKKGDILQSRDVLRVDGFRFSLGPEFEADLNGSKVTAALRRAFAMNEAPLPAGAGIRADDDDGSWVVGSARGGYRVRRAGGGDKFDVYLIDGDPIFKHDPFYSFGLNTLYLVACLAVPLILVWGNGRREFLYVGIVSAGVLACCHFEPLGNILGRALPMSIFWRAQWMVPQLINAGMLGVILAGVLDAVVSRRGHGPGPAVRSLCRLAAVGAFAGMLGATTSHLLRAGKPPKQLHKFSEGIPELVELLGGIEASPFVWGTFLPHHELPQLMPNIKLVFSRDKFLRPADDPNFRNIALGVFERYRQGRLDERLFQRLLELYPIDHVVVDRRYERGAKELVELLKEMGWAHLGNAWPYEVWRKPGPEQVQADANLKNGS